MFDDDNFELLETLNNQYSRNIGYKLLPNDEELTPDILKNKFKKLEDDYQIDEEHQSLGYQKGKESSTIKIYKNLIFDGQIDDTWLEYINNFYDKENFLLLANGDKINCKENFKLFFETLNLKNSPPSFLTRQIIIHLPYEENSIDSILYNWVEVNPKISVNPVLKNYIR